MPRRGDTGQVWWFELTRGATVAWLVVIFGLCVASIVSAPTGARLAPWWPAAGVSAALLLLSRPRLWPSLALLLMVLTGLGNLVAGRPPMVSALFGVANAIEAVVLALLLTAGGRRAPSLEAGADVRRLFAAVVAASVLLGTLAGLTVAVVQDGSFLTTLRSASASHAAAHLIVLPLALFWLGRSPARTVSRPRLLPPGVGRLEAGAQVVLSAVAVAVIFGAPEGRPLAYLVLPVFLWGALRLTPVAAMVEVLLAAAVCDVLSAAGRGPFRGLATDGDSLVQGSMLQAFIAVLAMSTLVLAVSASRLREAFARTTQERNFSTSVLESTQALMLVMDKDMNVVRMNAAAIRASGRPPHELIGSPPWRTVFDPATEPLLRHGPRRSGPDANEHELTWIDAAGGRRTIAWTSARLRNGDGSVVMTGIDVTARHRSEALLSTVLEATTGNMIVGASPTGMITFLNVGGAEALGYTSRQVVGWMSWVDLHDAEELAARASELGVGPGFEAIVAGASSAAQPLRNDWTWRRRDGSALTVSVTVTPMRDPDDVLVGYVGVATDVTDRRRTETALRDALEHQERAVERLLEVDQLKSDFVAAVSHELRTPLTGLLGYVHLLRSPTSGALTSRQADLVSGLDRNGQRLLTLIEDLLTLSAAESGTHPAQLVELDLRSVARSVAERGQEFLAGRDLELSLDLPDVPCPVRGDRGHLDRMLVNLVSNAVKFTPDGGRVSLRVEASSAGGGPVVRVSDTGTGIPEADVPHVFEPFFRSTSASEAQIRGTGLGLAIVAGIVEEHHGTVSCRSAIGAGTVIEVQLPHPEGQPAGSAAGKSDATSVRRRAGSNGLTR